MYSARYGRPEARFDDAALRALRTHAWPGNVRELEHWVESAVVLAKGGKIAMEHLPRGVRTGDEARPRAMRHPGPKTRYRRFR